MKNGGSVSGADLGVPNSVDHGNNHSDLVKNVLVACGLLINLISSVAIIQFNKYIYTQYFFSNMCLTCIHFLVTFVCLILCVHVGIVDFVHISIKRMLPMAISFCGYILLTNYSLQFNSIGTYQCLKALSTPGVMIISVLFYKHEYSAKVKLTVVSLNLFIWFKKFKEKI